MKKTRIHILAVAVLCLSTVSCSESFDTSFFEKEIEDPSLALGLKIGYSVFTANELFEEIGDDIQVGTTNDNGKEVVSFTYSQSLSSTENSDFVSVDNQQFLGNFDLLAGSGLVGSAPYFSGLIPGDEISESFKENQTLILDSDLTAAYFSEGTFTISLTTTTEAQTVVEFTIPSLKRKSDGGSYNRTFILQNNNGSDLSEVQVDLADYDFDFTYDILNPTTSTLVNNVAIQLDATVSFETGDQVSSDDKLTYNISLADPKIKTAYGDFKDASFNIENQTFDLAFFEELGEGNIIFENPILKLTATSGYGFPVGLTLETISATDGTTTNNLAITDATSLNDNIEPIIGDTDNHYAVIKGATTVGETIATTITLDSQNSNLGDLLNNKPNQFNLNVSAGANPNSPNNNSNFFDVTNTLAVDVEVELPLHVTFDGLTFNPEPFEFDTEDIADLEDQLNSLDLLLYTRNSIPLTGNISLNFLDINNNIVFTKPASLMEAAPIDDDGFSTYTLGDDGVLKQGNSIIEPTSATVTLDSDNISNLSNVTQIQATIEFNTTNTSAAKIQSTDKVRLDLSLVGDFKFGGEDEDNN